LLLLTDSSQVSSHKSEVNSYIAMQSD